MTAQGLDFNISTELRADLKQWRTRALAAGITGAALTAAGLFVNPNQFYQSYLWSYIFIVALTVGPLAWLMLQYITGGAWGLVIRRACEAAARTLPLTALMFTGQFKPGHALRFQPQSRDHGKGVPEESIREIFRPFYRVDDDRDRKTGGTGLGLSIAARAVHLHHGTIKAANAKDGGLIVEIRLPLSQAS